MAVREERARGRRARKADPNLPPFSSFLERDAARKAKQKRQRRTLLISLGVHAFALAVLAFFSFWQVDELWGRSVKVTVFAPAQVPPAARPSAVGVQLTPSFERAPSVPAPGSGAKAR